MSKKKNIKTSKHTIKFSNTDKINELHRFIDEYRHVSQQIIDRIWSNGYFWTDKLGEHEFNINKNLLYFPSYIDYNVFNINTFLSARTLSSLVTQVAGMISSEVEKQRKRLYVLKEKKDLGISKRRLKPLIKNIKQNIPQKPTCDILNPELSSKCTDIEYVSGEFDMFIRLKSIVTDRDVDSTLRFL